MFKSMRSLLIVSVTLMFLLAGCNSGQGTESSTPPSDTSSVSGDDVLKPSIMQHEALPYGEESRMLEPEMKSASSNVTYLATIEDSDTAFLEFYGTLEKCGDIDGLREKSATSMEGIKELLSTDDTFMVVEEYVDEANGIQVYSVADTNLEMYSIAYQIDGSVIVSYVNTWDVYTNSGDPADFTDISEKMQKYVGFKISAEDLVWAYNSVLDSAIVGGTYQLNIMDATAYRYVTFRITDFGLESEVWDVSVVSEYTNYDAYSEEPEVPEPEEPEEPVEPEDNGAGTTASNSSVVVDDMVGAADVFINGQG